MGGLASALGNSKIALAIALIVQAIIFGLVHFYKGPLGMTNSMVSGLVFGLLVIQHAAQYGLLFLPMALTIPSVYGIFIQQAETIVSTIKESVLAMKA